MPEPHKFDPVVRTVLHAWSREQAGAAPGFDAIRAHLARNASPMDASRWDAGRSMRLAAALTWRQLRVVPWLVLPVALVTTALAVFAARFFGVMQGGHAGESGFAAVLLVGVAVTMAMAMSPSDPDTVALSTPLGPQVVVLTRVTAVLLLDTLLALAASATASRYASSPAALLFAWLVPIALVAGTAVFASIWVAPWAGVALGVLIIPVVCPTSGMISSLDLGGRLHQAAAPTALVLAGVLLLAGCVASARRACERSVLAA